ncbi:OLC1v1007099C1 [Oldenlandia corymbosa var. corymbosa]|uniref:OLC1v1007099C1 n=1 Tax=Oldenlandia corymbosa var. corymbosa TaxID=529605 RepID=A0AAV1DKX6_OLDCO|nr:OLC1v1007099C1 [Oldenlandia corymbosa var. corymbosa]
MIISSRSSSSPLFFLSSSSFIIKLLQKYLQGASCDIRNFSSPEMAVRGVSPVKSRNPCTFMAILSSAACEWFLIFMLFLDAALSYLLTKFALYCELQTPCLLCSRIEYVFGESKRGYYWRLLCGNHREEISSLVFCHTHNKLGDVHAMCADCLTSYAKIGKSSSESCRLLIAKLGIDIEDSGLKSLLLNKRSIADSSGPRNCSCCNKLLKAKSSAQRLLQVNPIGNGASKANVKPPLPRVPGRSRFSRRDSLKRLRDKFSGPMTPRLTGGATADSLSHVGYTELKISSDTESEFPFSDDDDIASAHHGSVDSRTESDMKQDLKKLPKVVSDNSFPGNHNHQISQPLPSLLDQPVQGESSKTTVESVMYEKHGLEELNWPLPTTESISSRAPEASDDIHHFAENPIQGNSVSEPSNLSILSEVLSLSNVLSQSTVAQVTDKSDITETEENGNISVADASPILVSNHTYSTTAVTNTNKEQSGMLAEPLRKNGSGRAEETLHLPPRVVSPDMNLSPNISSPRVPSNHDGLQRNDDTVDMLQLAAALERHDFVRESLDGINVKEIEGETAPDRLRRQVDYDKRCMKALFKELEEERGASAIAANQAMAMITRLQEEKASLHMEALQYLRMMEEQAEYDMEALEKANDLLAEREKEVQDLEAELEIYRNNILDDPSEVTSNKNVESKTVVSNHTTNVENDATEIDDSQPTDILKQGHKHEHLSSTDLDFEDEKLYIHQRLEDLEKKIYQFSRNASPVNLTNGYCPEKLIKGVHDREEIPNNIQTEINHQNEDNGLSSQKDLCANGRPRKDKSADLIEGNNHPDSIQDRLYADGGGNFLDSFMDDITDLKNRLQALENNHDILEHALRSLGDSSDGLKFIREIAYQLEELRKLEFNRRLTGTESETSDASELNIMTQ